MEGATDEAVCEICGSGNERERMVNCGQCNAYQHCYCLPVLIYQVTNEWCCDECQNKSNGDPSPSQGGQTTVLDNNLRNSVHQVGHKMTKKFENAKVKFISCEEAALLNNKERPPHCRSRFSARQTCSQVCPASPPNLKLPPSRSDTQVPVLKQCAAASQNQTKILDINMKQEEQSGTTVPMLPCSRSRAIKGKIDSQIQNDPRAKKVVGADKGIINTEILDDPRQKSESNATDTDIGCGSEMSPSNNMNMLMVIHSSVEYARRPPPESCWTGSFLIFDGENHNLGEFKAYFPSKVSSKVHNVTKNMPKNLKLEMLPLADDWPKCFETYLPVYEDIGLIFFPTELDRNEYRHPCPLKTGCNFVLRAYINNIKLLIYSSEVLPPDSLWIDGEMYLWGVFVNSKRMHSPLRFGSIST